MSWGDLGRQAARALHGVAPGDTVLVDGSPRLVRRATYDARDGLLRSLTVAIRRCSWTKRAYTVIVRSDFRVRGVRRTRAPRVRLRRRGDRQLARCIDETRDRSLGCCDVAGWP